MPRKKAAAIVAEEIEFATKDDMDVKEGAVEEDAVSSTSDQPKKAGRGRKPKSKIEKNVKNDAAKNGEADEEVAEPLEKKGKGGGKKGKVAKSNGNKDDADSEEVETKAVVEKSRGKKDKEKNEEVENGDSEDKDEVAESNGEGVASKNEDVASENGDDEENAEEVVAKSAVKNGGKKGRGKKGKGKDEEVEEPEAEEKPVKNKRAKKEIEKVEEAKEEPIISGKRTRKAKGAYTEESTPPKRAAGRKAKASSKETEKKAEGRGRKKATKVTPPKEESDSDEEETTKKTSKKGVKRGASKDESDGSAASKKTKSNPTETDWETTSFQCTRENALGKTTNFHITSWNVDGLRAWMKKGGLDIIEKSNPDIFCMQETKCSVEKLPEEIKNLDGYKMYWCSSDKEGYAGVGICTKTMPIEVFYGIENEEQDAEGRCITAEFKKFYLVNVYVPNAGRGLVTLPKRLEWNEAFNSYIKKLDQKKPVIICGDMNVAHSEIDLANPKTNTKNAGFTKEEREGMTDFLGQGFVDTFRHLYPDKEKAYTFWTYMSNARAKNTGWRLDYFLMSERFVENMCDNVIHNKVLGSDHCPLTLYMNI